MKVRWRFGAVASALVVLCAQLAEPTAIAAASVPSDLPQEAIYAISINGEHVSAGTVVLRLPKDGLLVKASDLRQWRVKIPPIAQSVSFRGSSYYSFASLGAVGLRIDRLRQELSVDLPAAAFEPTLVGPLNVAPHPIRNSGAFIDYDLYGQTTSFKDNFVNGLFSVGLSGQNGVLLLRTLASVGLAAPKVIRLDTVWQHDDATKRSTLLAGDAISSAGSLGSAIRFGGVQVASNFATDPTFVTFPLPVLAGQAAVPSTLSVYVNNV